MRVQEIEGLKCVSVRRSRVSAFCSRSSMNNAGRGTLRDWNRVGLPIEVRAQRCVGSRL